jgi:hypothetical protein
LGISPHGARFLLCAKQAGVDFGRLAMIGRQGLFVTPRQMRGALAAFGEHPSETDLIDLCQGSGGFAERFFEHLGAREIHSFDYADFEGATFTHDMNAPIPDRFKQSYSVVLDSGTLEHVFNFPVAIKNCMEMVEVGGCYVAITPANNFFGHGFYQYSPELFFAVLSEENGFELETMLAFEETARPTWYDVKNPVDAGDRVTLLNAHPVYLCIVARRTAAVPILARPPQQHDYAQRWEAQASPVSLSPSSVAPAARPLPIRLAKMVLPAPVRRLMRKALERPQIPPPKPGFDPRFFRPIGPQPRAAARRG